MTLSAVCGRWRELAIAIPSLWASIEIDSVRWNEGECQLLPHLTQIFLERSKSVPLKLELNFLRFDLDAEEWEDAKRMFEVLIQYSHRWYSLKLCILRTGLDHHLYQYLRGRLPMLKHESVDNDGRDDNDETTPWDIFELCLSLTSFSLQPGDSLTKGIVLPWHQITSATFEYSYSVHNAFDILSRCPNLEWLYVETMDDEDESDRVHHLHSSTLRHLSVHAISHTRLSRSIGNMTLPQVASVEISGVRERASGIRHGM
uniref:F-box domain-containing protein n=1 Tax=Moniliophthora roreri TaxID=221103 RepID=A0A0W0F0A5_MONRR